MPDKIRTVEIAICWGESTWNDGYYVDIPFDTPDDKMEEVGRSIVLGQLASPDHSTVVHCWLYCEEVDPMPMDDMDEIPCMYYCGCCPDESCSGAVIQGWCSHCGEDWHEEHGDDLR